MTFLVNKTISIKLKLKKVIYIKNVLLFKFNIVLANFYLFLNFTSLIASTILTVI